MKFLSTWKSLTTSMGVFKTTGYGEDRLGRSYQQGIANEDWFMLGGGDGTYIQVDPTDSSTVYFASQYGNLQRMNLRTSEVKIIQPKPREGEEAYRFDWNSPLFVSPHNPHTIYYGGNRLFKSTDRGGHLDGHSRSHYESGSRQLAHHGYRYWMTKHYRCTTERQRSVR